MSISPFFNPKERRALRKVVVVYYPGSAAADVTEEWPVLISEQKTILHKVAYISQTAVTGANTHSANLNVINRGTDGLGTTELGNVDFASGTDTVALVEKEIVAYKDQPPATRILLANAVLTVQREKVGNGLILPEGVFVVEYSVDF